MSSPNAPYASARARLVASQGPAPQAGEPPFWRRQPLTWPVIEEKSV
jgi:hypothetical protein